MVATKGAAAEWRGYWFLPLVAGLGYATSVLHVYSLGPFIAALHEAFGWSRAQASAGLTVAALISALGCIPVGMAVDRIGPRRIGLIGVPAMCGAFALLSTANGEFWNWLALWVVIALGTICVQATVWTSAVASRFETSRGLAFALTLSGASGAAALYPVAATWLIGAYGWRTAFVAMGGLWLAFVFPLILFFFRGSRDVTRKHTESQPAPAALTGMTLAEGLRSPVMYKLLMAAGLFAFTAIGAVVHFVPILTDAGATPLSAAAIASLIGIFSIIGRLGTGVLLDRFPSHIVGACAWLVPSVGCILLLTNGSDPWSQAAAAAIFGLTVGSEVDVIAYLASKHFGLKSFGALYGVLQIALAAGTAFGPLAAGAVFDQYQSYAPFLMATIVLMTASAIALFTLGPPRLAESPGALTVSSAE